MASESKSGRGSSPRAKQPPPKAPARRRGSLSDLFALDSERSARLMLIGGVAAVLVLAVGFLAFGYYNSVIKPRNRTVLGADGTNVSYSAIERRMRYELHLHPEFAQSQQAIQVLPDSVMQTLLNEITLVSRGPSDQGIQVDDSELDAAVRTKVGVSAQEDQRRFADALRTALKESGLHENEYRRIVLADTIKNKLQQKFLAEVPATAQQAKVDVIATSTTDAANAAIARVKFGEDWAAVAKDVSTDSDAKTTGGIHDYGPQGSFSPAYDGYAFTAPVGQISQPLLYNTGSSTTYYVVRVEDRADKPVTDAQKSTVSTKTYNDWLSNMQGQMNVVKDFDDQSKLDALGWVAENHLPAPTATAAAAAVPTINSLPTEALGQPTPNDGAEATPPEGAASPEVPNQPVAPGNGQ